MKTLLCIIVATLMLSSCAMFDGLKKDIQSWVCPECPITKEISNTQVPNAPTAQEPRKEKQ